MGAPPDAEHALQAGRQQVIQGVQKSCLGQVGGRPEDAQQARAEMVVQGQASLGALSSS